jgi:hypothetical protein
MDYNFKFVYEFGIIYRILNLKNNKSYIGQTKHSLHERKLNHLAHARSFKRDTKIIRALRKYSLESDWQWYIIHIVQNNENINDLEIKYIKEFDSYINGYNSTLGGQGFSLEDLTEEDRNRILLTRSGKNSKVFKYLYWVFDKKGKILYEYDSITLFCKEHNLNLKSMRSKKPDIGILLRCKNWIFIKIEYNKIKNKSLDEIEQIKKSKYNEFISYHAQLNAYKNIKYNYRIFKEDILIYTTCFLLEFCTKFNLNLARFTGGISVYGHYKDYTIEKIPITLNYDKLSETQKSFYKNERVKCFPKRKQMQKINGTLYFYKIYKDNVLIKETDDIAQFCQDNDFKMNAFKSLIYGLSDRCLRGQFKGYRVEKFNKSKS